MKEKSFTNQYVLNNFNLFINELSEEEMQNLINMIKKNTNLSLPIFPIVKPGDYIKYNSLSNYLGLWRVLYDGTSQENGNRVEIISDKVVEKTAIVYPPVTTDYANIIYILNELSKKYLNPKYAISSRCVGSNPVNPKSFETVDERLINFSYKSYDIKIIKLIQEHHKIDLTALRTINSVKVDDMYYLASRTMRIQNDYIEFCCRYIEEDGKEKSDMVLSKQQSVIMAANSIMGLRPVISINPMCRIISGSGTKKEPYILS